MKRGTAWLVGALTATLLMAALLLANGLCYADAGDAMMMKAFAGYQGGVPAHFHAETNTALNWLLCGLQSLLPRVAWLSVLQLAVMWLSCAVVVRGAAKTAALAGLSGWAGAALGALLFAALGWFALCRADHVSTAALAGMAAVVQLGSVDYRTATDRQVLQGALPSVGLLLASLCLYERAGLAALALWLLAGWYVRLNDYSHREVLARGTAAHKGLRGLAAALLVGVMCVACFWGVRALEMGAMSEYGEWQRAYARLSQSPAFPDAVTEEALKEAGWTSAQLDAVASGFLYGVSAEKLDALSALLPARPETASLPGVALDNLAALWRLGGAARCQLLLCAALAFAATLLCALAKKRAILCVPPALALVVGLALMSLFPVDMDGALALCVLAPISAMLLWLILRLLPAAPRRALPRGLACAVIAAACLLCAARGQTEADARVPGDAAFESGLAVYALEKPDKLILYSPELATDTRLFPDLEAIPQNIVLPDISFVAGDALAAQFKRFGLDARRFRFASLLEDGVLFAGTEKGPWRKLLPYLQESMTGTYNWASYETRGALSLYKLCER